ncbi:hypothetical protein O181_042082 [Austropuccinia psidii MF-1]|uniref:mannan endo-1,4-beta-mannosidase n=1 Tax=Austropuccinia psidii MF-1 TaxID=1389203 RepID=A0A9Q3DM32_9BASI|nr:hypothetical protein [Austropuccinia psidii MF-1]
MPIFPSQNPNRSTPTILLGGEYQCRDLLKSVLGFGRAVARTYTLHVANDMFSDGTTAAASAHIIGWDNASDNWVYNETNWKKIDNVLDLSRQYGVKLIIPIINQDFGTPETDFNGNFNDLTRHRFNITDYRLANTKVDWFTDPEMIRIFKKLISFFLNRINTVNGIRYGDDDTILAFETGNEMNWGDPALRRLVRPAAANWTLTIAKHLKSLAHKTLVMDGSFSRTPNNAWEEDVLKSEYVDLFSYHFYGEGDIDLHDMLNQKVRSYNKTLVIGEHGFYRKPDTFTKAYSQFTCAGALLWSLRPHSENGGFETNSEGHNIYSYHVPGWEVQTSKMFDTQEAQAVQSTYNASYQVLGLEPPLRPVPGPPELFFLTNGTQVGLSWRGSAWAAYYEVFGATFKNSKFELVCRSVEDNVEAGKLFVPLDPKVPTKSLNVTRGKAKAAESHQGWVDQKWSYAQSERSSIAVPSGGEKQENNTPLYTTLSPNDNTNPQGLVEGGWYFVRGISADGIAGQASQAVFLQKDWKTLI